MWNRQIMNVAEESFPWATMSSTDLDSKFKGIWLRALNEPSLENLTPELIVEWAVSKGLGRAHSVNTP
jgi:beta-mannanase